jgi:hypothetical protein
VSQPPSPSPKGSSDRRYRWNGETWVYLGEDPSNVPLIMFSPRNPDLSDSAGCLWSGRVLWLSLLALGVLIGVAEAAGWGGSALGGAGEVAGIFLALLALAVVIAMGIANISFRDLFTRPTHRGPQPHDGRLVIRGSGGRYTAVVAMVFLLGGVWLPAMAASGGSLLTIAVFVVELAGAIAIAVAIWLRRTIVIDAKTIALTGFWGRVVASCRRAEVASIQGWGEVDESEPGYRLCNSSGRTLLTIHTGVFFTDRQVGLLASLLAGDAAPRPGSPADFPINPQV